MINRNLFELFISWVDYALSDLRCFGQRNLYPSQRATMEITMQQIDRIMPIGSLIPWLPRLNSNDENMATYAQTKGWIKCDGKEVCDQGLFEGQTCPSLADRGLIGANESKNKKTAKLEKASIPQHYHEHQHTMNRHDHQYSTGDESIDTRKASYYHCGDYPLYTAANHNHNTKKWTSYATSTMQKHSAALTSVSGANIGENLPAHIRVDYLFKCY